MMLRGMHDSLFTSKASVSLEFLVVGAGMSGLSCAFNLARAGHHVRVVERLESVGKATGGLRLTPNLTRLLYKWGLGSQLKTLCKRCTGLRFYDGSNAELLGRLDFPEEVWKDLQSPMLNIRFSDLHGLLLNLAQDAGVQVDFNAEVIEVDPCQPCVTLSTGEKIVADIIVGADGSFSAIRQEIVGDVDDYNPGLFTVYTFIITEDCLAQDTDLLQLARSGEWHVWQNSEQYIVTYSLNSNHDLGVVIFTSRVESDPTRTSWSSEDPISLSETMDISVWNPMIQRLLILSKDVVRTSHVRQPYLDNWYHASGKVILIGEAAHVQVPSSISTPSIMVEDGVVFATLFSHLSDRSQIPSFFSAFQELREGRAVYAMDDEISKNLFCMMPPGLDRDQRDAGLREAMKKNANVYDEAGEEFLRTELERWKTLFWYDAYEAAEAWWLEWGLAKERHHAMDKAPQSFLQMLSVTQSVEIEGEDGVQVC